MLRSDTDDVGRARHKAGPIPYDQHPCHRDDRFLPAAARMPYPGELRKEHRIFGYGHPGVLDEGRADEPGTHARDAPLVLRLSRRVFAARESHETGNLLSTRETGEILPQFEDEPEGGEPADARETAGDGKGLAIAFLVAELSEGCPQGKLMSPQFL